MDWSGVLLNMYYQSNTKYFLPFRLECERHQIEALQVNMTEENQMISRRWREDNNNWHIKH